MNPEKITSNLVPYKGSSIGEDGRYTIQSPSDSFNEFFNSSPIVDTKIKKMRTMREFKESDGEEDQEDISKMAKRIKFLEDQIRAMSSSQLKMQEDMQALIKKFVKSASRPVIKATDKMVKANTTMENVVAN